MDLLKYLKQKDIDYINEKGFTTIRQYAKLISLAKSKEGAWSGTI